MKFNGREVVMVRRCVVGDPYFDPLYDRYVVDYADGTGREYVKRAQLEDFVAPPEDKFDRSVTEDDQKEKVMTQREAIEDNRRIAEEGQGKKKTLTEAEKAKAREANTAKPINTVKPVR